MHEMSLCESILQVIESQAQASAFQRVLLVRLEVGVLAGVEWPAMEFGWEVVTRGTLADGARLERIEVPGSAWCFACAESVPISRIGESCPKCGGFQLQVGTGEELRIKDLQVE
ncbi:MAG: hydrogenase maturation nickel metallochaperone HypA [Planctomycetota bacterium]